MTRLGIRCSNTDFAYAVLRGTKHVPEVIETNVIGVPAGYRHPEALDWLYQEIERLISSHGAEMIVIKRSESRRRNGALEARLEFEGAVALAGHRSGRIPSLKKVKSTIAKDLGLKGFARYLKTRLDTTPIEGFDSYPSKQQEAILSAWSELAP
jgi:hypothetical protein